MVPPNNPTKAGKPTREIVDEWPGKRQLRPRNELGKVMTKSEREALGLEDKLKNMSLSDAPESGNSGLPASISISIGKADMSEDQMEEYGASVDLVKNLLNSAELAGVEDLDDARGALTELSEKTEAVAEFKGDHSCGRYQVVSFSKLTKEHLADMGVTSKYLSKDKRDRIFAELDFHVAKSGQQKKEPLSVIFDEFWGKLTQDGRYIKDFRILKKSIGRKPEARARILTDYILTQVMVFVEEELDLVQFMFLELVLSSSRHPASIIHNNTATLLTGSVDYAILSSLDKKGAVAKSLNVVEDGVYNLFGDMSSGNNFEDIESSSIWPIISANFNRFKFTLIEEKRKNLGKKELKDCEPQVTGEALVLQENTEKAGVLWCLSNGEEWIFGGLDDKKSRSFPSMFIDDKNLEEGIQGILKMLVLWTVGPAKDLKRYLEM